MYLLHKHVLERRTLESNRNNLPLVRTAAFIELAGAQYDQVQ